MADVDVGARATLEFVVTEADTSQALGSGDVPVLATPRAIAWAEAATCAAVADALADGETTVGVRVAVGHRCPSRVGETVVATAVVATVDPRRISFDVTVVNPDGETALTGTVERVALDREAFLA
jgi:predicted thioesterase